MSEHGSGPESEIYALQDEQISCALRYLIEDKLDSHSALYFFVELQKIAQIQGEFLKEGGLSLQKIDILKKRLHRTFQLLDTIIDGKSSASTYTKKDDIIEKEQFKLLDKTLYYVYQGRIVYEDAFFLLKELQDIAFLKGKYLDEWSGKLAVQYKDELLKRLYDCQLLLKELKYKGNAPEPISSSPSKSKKTRTFEPPPDDEPENIQSEQEEDTSSLWGDFFQSATTNLIGEMDHPKLPPRANQLGVLDTLPISTYTEISPEKEKENIGKRKYFSNLKVLTELFNPAVDDARYMEEDRIFIPGADDGEEVTGKLNEYYEDLPSEENYEEEMYEDAIVITKEEDFQSEDIPETDENSGTDEFFPSFILNSDLEKLDILSPIVRSLKEGLLLLLWGDFFCMNLNMNEPDIRIKLNYKERYFKRLSRKYRLNFKEDNSTEDSYIGEDPHIAEKVKKILLEEESGKENKEEKSVITEISSAESVPEEPDVLTLAEEWNLRGINLYNSGDYEDAIECYNKAILLYPAYVDALYNKGNALDSLEQYEEAVKCYDRVLDIDPVYIDAWYNKGNALDNLGNYDEEIKCFDKALEINPEDADTWYNKGNALYNTGKYNEAIKCYESALTVEPLYTDSWYNKGNCLYNLGKHEEAIKCYDKALAIQPDYADAWNNKGLVLYNMDNYKKAIECFDRALEIEPSYEHARKGKEEAIKSLYNK